MQINKILFKNFKSYYDKNELDLSVTDKKNVVVIYADSGFGKTTILEAINWALYDNYFIEKLNKKNTSKDKLNLSDWINEAHLKETISSGGIGEVLVEINYEVENEKHQVINSFTFSAESTSNVTIKTQNHVLKKLQSGDIWRTSTSVDVDINKVLPRNIVDYFFFDAEKQSRLVMPSNQQLVQEAIYNVIGLKKLESAASNLTEVAKDYSRQLGRIDLGQLSKAQKRKNELEEIIDDDKKRLKDVNGNISAVKERIDDIESKLLNQPDSQKYQKKIEELKGKLGELLTAKSNSEKSLANSSLPSIPFLMKNKLLEFHENLDGLKKSGKIPGTITINLLDEIFENKECLCGINLDKNKENKNRLDQLYEEVSKRSEEKDKLIDIYHSLKAFINEFNNNENKLTEYISHYDQINEAIGLIEEEIKQNEEQIGNIDNETIKDLNESRDKLNIKKDELILQKGSLLTKIQANEEELEKLNDTIDNIVIQDENAKKLKIHEKLARLASEELKVIFENFAKITKKEISQVTQEQWKNLIKSTSQLNFQIDDEFRFNITDSLGRNAISNLSNGQKQGLVLAFVSAISEVSKKFPPYIIDMPFGRLGEDSQNEASKFLPNSCKQLILLLNKASEYNETTMGNIKPKCNKLIELGFDSAKRTTIIKPHRI